MPILPATQLTIVSSALYLKDMSDESAQPGVNDYPGYAANWKG